MTGLNPVQAITNGILNQFPGLGRVGQGVGQGINAYAAYRNNGARGAASQMVGKGGMFGEGGVFGNNKLFGGDNGILSGYASGGLRGAATNMSNKGGFQNMFGAQGFAGDFLGSYGESGKSGLASMGAEKLMDKFNFGCADSGNSILKKPVFAPGTNSRVAL